MAMRATQIVARTAFITNPRILGGAGHPTMMHLVRPTIMPDQCFIGVKRNIYVKKPKTGYRLRRTRFNRINKRRAHHLITTTNAHNRSAPRTYSVSQTLVSQPAQIRDRRLGARNNNQISLGNSIGIHRPCHCHPWFARQRFHISGVRHPRQPNRSHSQPLCPQRGSGRTDRCPHMGLQRILRINPQALKIRQHRHCGHPGHLLQGHQTRLKNGLIPAEFIDHKALNPGAISRRHNLMRAKQMSQHSPTVNIAHHIHRHIAGFRKTKVSHIRVAEINFRR